MDRDKTKERIFECLKLPTREIDLIGKILDLEKDQERVHSAEVIREDNVDGYKYGISVNVYLRKGFEDLDQFKKYLKNNYLPIE